jgi:hypothetical protein
MAILPFPPPEGASAFDPASIRILSDALEEAWQSSGATFHIGVKALKTRNILARCIIELAKLGERDPGRLRDAALAHLAESRIRKGRE